MRGVTTFEITVQGPLPEHLIVLLGAATPIEMPEQTLLVTPWSDQYELYDLLCRLRDLGLEVTDVRRTADERATTAAGWR